MTALLPASQPAWTRRSQRLPPPRPHCLGRCGCSAGTGPRHSPHPGWTPAGHVLSCKESPAIQIQQAQQILPESADLFMTGQPLHDAGCYGLSYCTVMARIKERAPGSHLLQRRRAHGDGLQHPCRHGKGCIAWEDAYHGLTVASGMRVRQPAGGQQMDIALFGPQAGVSLLASQDVLCRREQGLPACWAGPGCVGTCNRPAVRGASPDRCGCTRMH